MIQIPPIVLYTFFFVDLFVAVFFMLMFVKMKLSEKEPILNKYYDISFVIPAYNAEKFLEETVKAVKEADYPQDKVKIIIVNDGSKDNTLAVAKKLAKEYDGIEVLDKKNSGKADSLNYGLKRAKTVLVAVLDSDTLIKKDLLKKSVAMLNDETMAAVACRFKPINKRKIIEKLQATEYILTSFYRKIMGKMNSLPAAPAFTVFRREFFLKHGYFDKDNITEDFEMGLRIQKSGYHIGYISDSYALTDVPNSIRKLYRQRLRWTYGGLVNYGKYKELFFRKSYGDFGMFVLPSGYVSLLITSFAIILTIITYLNYLWEKINLLMGGWVPYFNVSSFDVNSTILTITNLKFILLFGVFMIGILVFFLAKVEIDEEISIFWFILMVIFYLPLNAAFNIAAFAYFLAGKKPNW